MEKESLGNAVYKIAYRELFGKKFPLHPSKTIAIMPSA
jgi:hypothetical protein